jgi:hypothetical protein
VTVDDYHTRRTSRRAQSTAFSEVTFDVVAAVLAGPNRLQAGLRSLAEGYRQVNAWDREESDRVATHLDRALSQLGPAIFLLSFMDTNLIAPTQALNVALQGYAEAATHPARRNKSKELLTASLNEVGRVLGAVIEARWSHVLPRRRKLKQALKGRRSGS